ncbi:hypothetical protein CW676_09740 [Macrococcoides caseolyticum]|uniref:hypothetical protein n=1 Tax=Macrococcoides caseolyticum TaxID=69966 RepID=UPI000A294263|nr:hypothetical protein [Macrococcus caseolyticus]ARQ05336.1 hypothetical protein CA207_21430 [Macrococcus caseolyticus]ARQ05393.1 hypothetical protein CA207_22010 [Macrococcus caseolyticus]PKE06738.1 hypothetical protein CW692_06800 [Macrococcus caseolyticus]PKE23863.1 hypothetical protein CW689_06910 [Macrococcus caseolyticus]PKE52402.1 hypothetical protein CW676_09740 [Macrococcus caseolyticus]
MKLLKIFAIVMLLMLIPETIDAGGTTSSSGSSSSGSSASSSVARASTTSRAAMNASRINTMSRMNNTSRMSSSQNLQRAKSNAVTLAPPMRSKFSGPLKYQAAHNQFVNNQIFYGAMYGHSSNVQRQQALIRQQLGNRKAYTISVKRNGRERLYVVSKEIYDRVESGDSVHIKNGVVTLKE